MAGFVTILIIASTAWLAYDASQRDWSDHGFANKTWKWVVGALLLWIVVFPVYLVQRGKVAHKA